MESKLDPGAKLLKLRFGEPSEIETFMGSAAAQKAFMVPVDQAPKPLETYDIQVVAGVVSFTFPARMVQLFPGGGALQAAFALEGWSEEKEAALKAALSAPGPPGSGSSPESPAGAGDESETRGASPTFRIQQMDPGARARLAMKADRTERRILRRDNSPQVLMNLLSNPRVGADDVLAIVKAPSSNASILQRIAEDRRWMANTEIKTALVRQPKTPSQLAIKMLESLRTEDLRQMSKMGNLREIVRRAAFRVYQQRQRR